MILVYCACFLLILCFFAVGTFQPWGHTIQVDWADPEKVVDEETMQRVKVLYVRNLMISTTEDKIKAEFNKFKPGVVERVKKLRDYAFVHFFHREDAVAAMSVMNGKCIDGASIEVTLAKPVNKESSWKQHFNGQISPSSENLLGFLTKKMVLKNPWGNQRVFRFVLMVSTVQAPLKLKEVHTQFFQE